MRKKIEQEVYYRSFRYTSKNKLLKEFLNSLDNTNAFIKTIIMSSKRYCNYVKKNYDDGIVISSY